MKPSLRRVIFMRQALSTYLFAESRLTIAALDRIMRSGIEQIEIFCARQHFDYAHRAAVEELRHWFLDADLQVHSVHAPVYKDDNWGRSGPHSIISLTETSKLKRIAATDEIKRALEVADSIPFRYWIQHIGMPGEEYDLAKRDAAFNSLDELRIFAGQLGVEILLENIPNELSRADRLNHFLKVTHLPLHYCFDAGHAHMTGDWESELRLMGSRVRSTHIHDNDGRRDSHRFPPLGESESIPWARMKEMLVSLGGDLPWVLELRGDKNRNLPLDDVRACFEQLERL